jgi:hypothetical protein
VATSTCWSAADGKLSGDLKRKRNPRDPDTGSACANFISRAEGQRETVEINQIEDLVDKSACCGLTHRPLSAFHLGSSVSLMQQNERARLRRMAACVVSYLDTEGLRHTVEVEAESLYEAAVLAIRTFRNHECEPGQASKLEVEIRSSVTHIVTLRKIHDWLNGGAKTPKEAVMKEKLRALL